MPLDPIKTTKSISDKYRSYLATTFRLSDAELQKQFTEQLSAEKFVKGPILEATPPFETEKSLRELITEGILSDEFTKLNSEKLLDRPLWKHQEMAIRRLVRDKRNIVVASGTGSGKTEAFLVPILNHLFREKENDELTPGIRALLLYPMNALANDQLKRLRSVLKKYPDITFGRYTGETEEKQKPGEDKYRKMYKREPLPNELVSREQMKENPPHILLTNYAMLEYLMLRPEDHVFFDGQHATNWKFIVIDEAHTYNGAKGIEMAMLLRRLKERIVQSEPNRLRCIATSATLGRGEKDFADIARFARQLFGESFDPEDIIKAFREPLEEFTHCWGRPESTLYEKWEEVINDGEISKNDMVSRLIEIGLKSGVPVELLEISKNESHNNHKKFLYYVLRGDERLYSLRRLLAEKPRLLKSASEKILRSVTNSVSTLTALVDLAVKAKPGEDDQSLLPARYHLFIRAIEGAFVNLQPEKRIYLDRKEKVKYHGKEYPVFEIATCRQCAAIYLVGETEEEGYRTFLKQPGKRYFESSKNLEYYLLPEENARVLPDNEDELLDLEDRMVPKGEQYRICGACGAVDKSNLVIPLCECNQENHFYAIKVNSKNGKVHKCPACARTNPKGSMVWRFLLGKDAMATVLATSLYQEIPIRTGDSESRSKHEGLMSYELSHGASKQGFDDTPTERNGEKRQLLIFSDSRQDAAFFAPYLNRTYSQILRRHLILKTIEENREKILENRWRVQDLVPPLKHQIIQLNLFPDKSPQQHENEVWKWVLYELLSIDTRLGLKGLGCLGFSLVKPGNWKAPEPLMKNPWNLSTEDEVWALFQILLDSFRKYGAIEFPDNVLPGDEFFHPRNREYCFRENRSTHVIKSWNPSSEIATNTRLDFFMRLFQRNGEGVLRNECLTLLGKVWGDIQNRGSCWQDYFCSHNVTGEGLVYRMKYNFWELRSSIVDMNTQWYLCTKCRNLTLLNLKEVCPTYRCEGRLRECNPSHIFRDNHYRNLYTDILPIRMKAKEHTAQLTSEAAAELQTDFTEGKVNVLSCSTTFELGVDVGELETVFMKNVPPSPANYIQRAGRAGRRTDSTAFALTFCQRRSWDLMHFSHPLRMVSGEIKPPHFKLENEKIVKRHIYATALAKFWKRNPEMFGNVNSFFFVGDKDGPELFREYLANKPHDLYKTLKKFVPGSLHKDLNIDKWGWVKGLFDEKDGVMSKAKEEVESDVKELQKVKNQIIQEAKRASDYNRAAAIARAINTIKDRYLIKFLSSRNVIPKYGFPVDVVELQVVHHSNEAKRLDLDRDLKIALSEYAPSSQVVAGGKLWTSRYLKKLPERDWPKYRYAVCDYCQSYHRILADSEKSLEICESCNRAFEGRNQGILVFPEFGFISSTKPPQKPGEEQPKRTYTTRTYYSGDARKEYELPFELKHNITLRAIPASHGKMAVINHAGYQGFGICHGCGYAILWNETVRESHKSPWKSDCSGKLSRYYLGHEYRTDILQLHFEGYINADRGFWFSLLYALIEGTSQALDIERQDLDGCLYTYAGDPARPAIILFDDVPGGAGHVRRIARDLETLRGVLQSAYEIMKECKCGGEEGDTSCSGCLRNYRNQFCHDQLKRGKVIRFLEQYFI